MVYALAFDAVKRKYERFDPPARLISDTELAAAIVIGYREAGMERPELSEFQTPEAARLLFLEQTKSASVNEKLYTIISNFESKSEAWSKDAAAIYQSEEGK